MELKCSMCNRDFDEFDRIPRLLPECGHSFCEKCIRNVIQERRNVFTCPIDKYIMLKLANPTFSGGI
jgi:hypothetical protein